MADMGEGFLFWAPGVAVPHEATSSNWKPTATTRRFAHANGRVGDPSGDVHLDAVHGSASVRVVTSTRVWYSTTADQRQCATHALVSLPALRDRPRDELHAIFGLWSQPERWAARRLIVDGRSVRSLVLHLDSGQWCLIARAGTNLLHLAGLGVAAADVQVRLVTDSAPYGLDLNESQWVSAVNKAADGRPY